MGTNYYLVGTKYHAMLVFIAHGALFRRHHLIFRVGKLVFRT